MANLLKTERDFDLALLELQMETEETFQKWQAEFKGPRMAHVQAQGPAVGPSPQMPPQAPPQTGY